MLKRIIGKILKTPPFPKFLISPILKLHSFCYIVAGSMAIQLNDGLHPKHNLMRYKEWFLDNIKKDWVVLDVGCNTGMMPKLMSSSASFIYGIELNYKLIEEAKNKRQKNNIQYICADATLFDYSQCKPIDCVTLSNVLEHIEFRVNFLKKLILQIKWKNKRRFLIRVPMIDRDWITLYKKELGLEWRLDKTHYTEYTFEEFKKELNKASIKIEKFHIRFGEIYAICEAK